MNNVVLEGRGYFWWGDESVPDRHWAPESSVTGALNIDDEGFITLELDNVLPEPGGPFKALFLPPPDSLTNRSIAGLLKDDRHVLLLNIRRHGGRASSNGISYSRYAATECLVGTGRLSAKHEELMVKQFSVDLSSYHQWMRREPISMKWTRQRVHATYVKEKSRKYPFHGGVLTLAFDVRAPAPSLGGFSDATITENIRLTLALDNKISLKNARERFGRLEELMILLTDSDHCLEWPKFSIGAKEYTHYFWRTLPRVAPPDWTSSSVAFEDLHDAFGEVFQAWCEKREVFGPGFYLYLGNRRGMKLYAEHRFVNLIWGLESFHRTKNPEDEQPSRLKQKINRILGKIELPRDRKWLANKLKTAHEPSLEERLFKLFSSLPLNFEPQRVRSYCKNCARLRNDISHFGGSRERSDNYPEFVQKIMWASTALSYLYHALLLQEIGITPDKLRWWIYEGHRSYEFKSAFVDVGLLDNSVLKPEP